MELECYEEAIVQLHMAHDLAMTQKMNFGDDITSQLRLAKKKHFAQQESKRIKEESDLQLYLERLIREDRDKQIEKLSQSNDLDETSKEISTVQMNAAQYLVLLDDIFTQIDDKRKMSFEILKDPVITPSGITYDRKDIEEHLQRV